MLGHGDFGGDMGAGDGTTAGVFGPAVGVPIEKPSDDEEPVQMTDPIRQACRTGRLP
jgi:hypothetical protein